MQKKYYSFSRPRVYTLIYLILGLISFNLLVLLGVLAFFFIPNAYSQIVWVLDVAFVFLLLLSCVGFLRSIFFAKKNSMLVAEINSDEICYYTRLNRLRRIYISQIKDIVLVNDSKVKIVLNDNSFRLITIRISEDEKGEYVSLVSQILNNKN